MTADTAPKTPRKGERVFLTLITVVLGSLFLTLFFVLQRDFTDVNKRLKDGTMINLNDSNPGKRIRTLLEKGYYFEDDKDIALIQRIIAERLHAEGSDIDNIGELNKKKYNVIADDVFVQGGTSFKTRVATSRAFLGYTGDDSIRFIQEKRNPPALPAQVNADMGKYSISGTIINAEKQPLPGVLVRLEMILPQDSVYSEQVVEVFKRVVEKQPGLKRVYVQDTLGKRQLQTLTAYARTDANGNFSFLKLPDDKAFEVLPLQPGYQFGVSKGIQELKKNVEFTFQQSPHTIRLLSGRDFNILKRERSLIVRTPSEFNRWYWIIAGSFFALFFLLHLLLTYRFPEADQLIIPVLMLLTGLAVLTFLSLQDPLRDRFLARDTLVYFAVGIVGIAVLMFFNIRRFTVDSMLYRMYFLRKNRRAANGWPWAVAAIGLLILTIALGTGPEGSGVKVNLFGFQPSEFVKYSIVLFLAGFFAANEKFISEYRSWRKRWQFFSFALIAIVISILLFLILGDLGPAMVVCFTFIILFSFSRGDFLYMIGAVVLYVLAVWLINNVWIATALTAVVLTFSMIFQRKQISESAIMTILLIAGFLLIDKIIFLSELFPGPMQRLVERKAIWEDAWNNEVFGGDHVANGIWAMASGGLAGQGIGEGFSKTIPEAHTDMILPAIGEEFGWTGIICIFILYLIYLHRAIIIGRRTGAPFLFYLCAGIGVSTFVQFLLIAGGSTGALPLSGVSLPMVSYGGSSLIANLLAAGFLLSASGVKGTNLQMAYITRQQDKNLLPALVAACIGIFLLTVNVSRYLFNNKKWVVQPALVADRGGLRMFSYNPRIAILMNRLQAGSIYDRDGRILATSKPELIKKQRSVLNAAGVQNYNLDSAMHKRTERYYPFAEQMFFWTGDANTGVFRGATNGYFAEYEHAAELRGFNTPVTNYNVIAHRFREDRFLPRGVKEMNISKRDYSALAPLLLAGINSQAVEEFKKRNRDVQLTMDAQLQTSIQKSLALDDSLKDNRVSVVIMESGTGDVLSSAVYPLPPVRDWDMLTMATRDQNRLSQWVTTADLGFTYATQPGSTAKVATSLAAFNKLGLAAATKEYSVTSRERIRTKGIEPDETGVINMERALVKSNNVYFIKLANEQQLQEEMVNIYLKTGMFLHGVGGYYFEKEPNNQDQENKWRDLWRKTEFNTKPAYDPSNIRRTRAKGISGMAWGQGELIATPAAIARLASGVANKGTLIPNRYVLKISDSTFPVKDGIRLANDTKYAELLTGFMIKQSELKKPILGIAVAGKSGTPERIWKMERINDGWYVFFAPKTSGSGHIVVCIRVESTKGSSDAVRVAGEHVIPFLLKRRYIQGFVTQPVQTRPVVSSAVPDTLQNSEPVNAVPDTNNQIIE